MNLKSQDFSNNGKIPVKFTRDGENVSPSLEWEGAPDDAKSYVLICEDPDAPMGTFRHWAVYDIAGGRNRFPQGADKGTPTERLGHGVNDFGNAHYDGPEPPPGHGPHHYHFKLAALNTPSLGHLPDKPSVEQIWQAAQPYVIDQAEIIGVYER